MMKKQKKLKISTIMLIVIYALCVILNVTAWTSEKFCNWYTENIFPFWIKTYGRLTSLVPFSVGEKMIIIALIGVPLSVLLLIVLLIIKKGRRKKVLKVCGITYLWIIAFVLVTETLNCFVLYHCSTFGKLYDIPEKEHTTAQLEQLCEELIIKTNELALQVERDENGQFVLTADLDETAKEAMKNLGDEFPRLGGYYVTPKPVKHSYFMSRQYLMGIYFPFSAEANYNRLMYQSNMPETVCHELAHTKGFIQEDEANFIAYLACIRSDNADYQYSGYLSALKYVINKVEEYSTDEKKSELGDMISTQVAIDYWGNSDYWQSVQEDDSGIVSSETVARISDKAMETSLKLNGVEDGKKSYGRMVDLLLNYYYDRS